MLYTFFVLLIGVYIGQDYNLPSVKNSVITIYHSLKRKDETDQNNARIEQPNWYSFYKNFITYDNKNTKNDD